MNDFVDDTIGRDLTEHFHWRRVNLFPSHIELGISAAGSLTGIKPDLNALELELVVDFGNGDSLNIDLTTVSLSRNLLSLAVTHQ